MKIWILEIEQKDNEIEILENKIELPDTKVIEEMNKLLINKISFKKGDRIMDRLNISLNYQKYIRNKKQKN